MNAIVEYVKKEPAILIALLGAVFALFAAFGLALTTEQTGAITAVVIIILGIVTRQSVTPNAAVAAKVENATGQVVTGQAAPPAGEPAAVVTSDDGTGLDDFHDDGLDEGGAFDSGLLIAAAAVVIIIVGVVWLFQAL